MGSAERNSAAGRGGAGRGAPSSNRTGPSGPDPVFRHHGRPPTGTTDGISEPGPRPDSVRPVGVELPRRQAGQLWLAGFCGVDGLGANSGLDPAVDSNEDDMAPAGGRGGGQEPAGGYSARRPADDPDPGGIHRPASGG